MLLVFVVTWKGFEGFMQLKPDFSKFYVACHDLFPYSIFVNIYIILDEPRFINKNFVRVIYISR